MARGRLSSFDTLPPEAEHIVSWAAQALSDRTQTQKEIYAEFVERCEELIAQSEGALAFTIPAFSSFHRYSARLAKLTMQMDQTRQIVAALKDGYSVEESDDLTVIAGEALKSVVFHLLSLDDVSAKDAMQLASALRQANQAQGVSTARRIASEKAFATSVNAAIDTVAREHGLSADAAAQIRRDVLGVRDGADRKEGQ